MTEPVADPTTIIAGLDGHPHLAIDVQPSVVEGTFSLDVSELDGYDLLGWGDEGWLNVIADVTHLRIARGATRLQSTLARAEAASIVIDLLDIDRRFDPLVNADAIRAGTPVRVRAWSLEPEPWSATLVTGELDELPVQYVRSGAPRVTLNASDVIAELARWSSGGRPEPGVGQGDNLRQRVDRLLVEVGLPPATVSPDSDAAFAVTHPATVLDRGWEHLTACADAELGRVWADALNRLVIRGRDSELSGPVRGTLSDWHGEAPTEPHCCYADLAAVQGTEQLVNRAIGQRRVPQGVDGLTDTAPTIQRDDTVSQALYRVRVGDGEQRALELETDTQVEQWCESVLLTSSRPELRVDSVQPAPWGAGPAAWRAVCSTDLGDRWLARYHPEVGPTVARTVGVLGIEHEVTPEGWSITWFTAPAPTPGENPTGWFALDVSVLDSGDLLAPFGGPVGALPT